MTQSQSLTPIPTTPPTNDPPLETWKPSQRELYEWLMDSHHEADIIEAWKARYPTEDLGAAMLRLTETFQETATVPSHIQRGWCIEASKHLYRKMVEIGDYKSALNAVMQIYKLSEKNPDGENS